MITFATKIWGGDYAQFMSGAFERKLEANDYSFDSTMLIINNGVPEDAVSSLEGIALHTIYVPQVESEILDHFKLNREDFTTGYNYAIGELAAILFCPTPYLAFVQGDCIISPESNWIDESLDILVDNPSMLLVSPSSEVNTWGQVDQFCSDQAFVTKVERLRSADWDLSGAPYIDDFPEYGGLSFEHKVAQIMRRDGLYRYILPNHYLHHPTYG